MAAYESYKTRLKSDPEAQKNFAAVYGKRVILREERNPLKSSMVLTIVGQSGKRADL